MKANKDGPLPVSRPDLGQCWLWLDAPDPDGYGKFWADGHNVPAHRFAYELLIGQCPPTLVADHLCRVRICVNPHHIEFVTVVENWLRGDGIQAVNKRKTHCKQGHPFAGDNLMLIPIKNRIERRCRICHRAQVRRFRLSRQLG